MKELNPHVTYWTVLAAIVVAAIGVAAWKRMSDDDRRKMLLGLR
jgi:hypothetical protein